jgi:small-conductance mechanosensitive channel
VLEALAGGAAQAPAALAAALTGLAAVVATFLPRLAASLLVLLIGWALARLLGWLVDSLLARLGLDRLAEETGLTEDLARVGLRVRPARIVGRLAYFIVLVAALVQAVDVLGLAPLSDALRRLLEFMPNVVLALAILLGGALAGEALARAVGAALARAGVLYHAVVATLVRLLVLILALLMALQQLTIEAGFVFAVLLLLLGAAAFAAALAFGWGARTVAENVASGRHVEQNFAEGDVVAILEGPVEVAGTIERLGLTSTTLRTADGRRVLVPNAIFARAVVQAEPAAAGAPAPPAAEGAPEAPPGGEFPPAAPPGAPPAAPPG